MCMVMMMVVMCLDIGDGGDYEIGDGGGHEARESSHTLVEKW